MGYSIKKINYQKNGSKWIVKKTTIEKFGSSYKAAKRYYNNIMSNNFGRTRTEYGYSAYSAVSSKSFYSPDGLEKIKYKF